MKKVVKYAEQHGFEVVRTKRHTILKRGNASVTVSQTPSCPFAADKALKDIKKVLQGTES